MSTPILKIATMTESEYLVFERAHEWKHEYRNGDVYEMAHPNEAHSLINVNVGAEIHAQVRERPFLVMMNRMRIKVEASTFYTYPDVLVISEKSQLIDQKRDTLTNPTLLIEILSPATEAHDRGKKFQEYRKIPSLHEYVLVAQDSPRIETFLLQADGTWKFTEVTGLDSSIELPSINCVLKLEEVYLKVDFEKDTD